MDQTDTEPTRRIIADLSIPLRFNGPQPNAYGVEPARAEAVRAGDVIGDTRLGGSVNFETYTFIPHCSGTHTECVGHITNERISVRNCLDHALFHALLISVEPVSIGDDRVITKALIEEAIARHRSADSAPSALILRTLPNSDEKLTAVYGADNIPPYFLPEAMERIVALGFTQLLVDMPSIDRLFDDGKLVCHRIFWNVEPGAFETNDGTRIASTVTEMIFVPNSVPDGEYLLNLQIAPFDADCAPSRPVLLNN